LPVSDTDYYRLKAGKLHWPPASRIWEFYHSLSRAWLAAGAAPGRITLRFCKWTRGEDDYLLNHAGRDTLADIADHLGRSYSATRSRLNKEFKITARSNQGLFTAAELALEFNCPYHRVRDALVGGKIKGRFDTIRNRWQVRLDDLTPANIDLLSTPKDTHKKNRTDCGDYYKRYGIHRHRVNGKIQRIEEFNAKR
jgi:hypothetical protein